jgi:hypothetical protein
MIVFEFLVAFCHIWQPSFYVLAFVEPLRAYDTPFCISTGNLKLIYYYLVAWVHKGLSYVWRHITRVGKWGERFSVD